MKFQEVLEQITGAEQVAWADNKMAVSDQAPDQGHWLNFAKWAVLAVNNDKYHEAHLLLKTLESLLRASDESNRLAFEPILTWLNYAAFDELGLSEAEDFFRQRNFTLLLNENVYFDLFNKFRLWLAGQAQAERDAERERIYNAMRANDSLLTETFINAERGTIANWLKEYDKAVGFTIADPLARIEFENQSVISARLPDEDRDILKKMYDFYEYIKLSSDSAAGFEDDFVMDYAGNTYLYTNGQEIPTSSVSTEQRIVDNMPAIIKKTEAAPGVSLPPLASIIKEAQAQLMATSGETPKVIAELQKNLGGANILGSAASLLLLAQLRRLDDVLSDAPAFRTLVAQDLEKSGQAVQQEGLGAQPNAPQFLARFLKIVLQDNLRLNPGEALDFGQRLGELMALEGDVFRRMVVKDERGQAKWNI